MDRTPLLVEKELQLLREELKALKECQTKYVGLAVTSTGVIFAYLLEGMKGAVQYNETQSTIISNPYPNIDPSFLTPLIILLPISCIFFDKATTISRVVGYYQIIESFSLYKYNIDEFIGWENSLYLLREYGRNREKQIKSYFAGISLWETLPAVCKIKYFLAFFGYLKFCSYVSSKFNSVKTKSLSKKHQTNVKNILQINEQQHSSHSNCRYCKKTQMYWRLIYITFLVSSLFCFVIILLPSLIYIINIGWAGDLIRVNKDTILLTYILLIISFRVFKFNLKTLYQLEMGFHSYKANHIFWKTILLKKKEEINSILEKEYGNKDSSNKNRKLIKKIIPFINHHIFVLHLAVIIYILFY